MSRVTEKKALATSTAAKAGAAGSYAPLKRPHRKSKNKEDTSKTAII